MDGHVLLCPHDSGRHRDGELNSAFQARKLFSDKEKPIGGDIFCHGFHFALIGLKTDSESHRKTYCRTNWIVSNWHLPLSHAPLLKVLNDDAPFCTL
jgi:hypothetical protein